MVPLIKDNIKSITDACNKHHVKTLYLFGSAVRMGDFNDKSDIDFLVEFDYSGDINNDVFIEKKVENIDLLKSKLENITRREVDLVQEKNIRNKFLKYFINKEKKLIYGIS
jgi:predicted nucleotidyltransferase